MLILKMRLRLNPSFKRIMFRFAEKQNNQIKNQQKNKNKQQTIVRPKINLEQKRTKEQDEKIQADFTNEQRQLIEKYKGQERFYNVIQMPRQINLQKQLIIARKTYNKSLREHRTAILFHQILSTQTQIPLYDTKQIPFTKSLYTLFFISFSVIATALISWSIIVSSQKTAIIVNNTKLGKTLFYYTVILCVVCLSLAFNKHLKFQKFHVEKIIYNTSDQHFIFHMRKFWGKRYTYNISRYKLLYTENKVLQKFNINYFQINTFNQFAIGFKDAWLKEDLFSHLIAQRIVL